MHKKRIAIYDIAKKAGVLHTTIALALRNHYRISENRRNATRLIASGMGYAPDPFLATLASYRAQIRTAKVPSLGVIIGITRSNCAADSESSSLQHAPIEFRNRGEPEGDAD